MMVKKFNLILFTYIFVLLALPKLCFADQVLRVAFGNALPPWVIPEKNSGIIVDIIKECLEPIGYKIENIYFPYARRIIAYKNDEVDAVCDINRKIMAENGLKGHLSTIAYAYENIAVSLKKNKLKINSISDLSIYSVIAWQGAKEALSEEYALMANSNKEYREIADQEVQVKLLFSGREEVIQIDRQIFQYYRNRVFRKTSFNTEQLVDVFPIFGKNECGFLFKDKKIQVVFDSQFAKLKESGEYDRIYKKYYTDTSQ